MNTREILLMVLVILLVILIIYWLIDYFGDMDDKYLEHERKIHSGGRENGQNSTRGN